ncbi:MAG: glycosyltransferase family 2 protein [Planctomycetota bacterium]
MSPEELDGHGTPNSLAPAAAGAPARSAKRLPLVSIVIPVLNEEKNLEALLEEIVETLMQVQGFLFEILVIDDGSSDRSSEISRSMDARVVTHPVNLGNGAAVKRGIREARGDWILLMDGDGQHPPSVIPELLEKSKAWDMVVASRGGSGGSLHRNLANRIYNGLASYVTGMKIPDLTSGFRIARADALQGFVTLLPNTFSYPTTITLAMIKSGYAVSFHPFEVRGRHGLSKINLLRDGSRFLLIIVKLATFTAPLKVFLPVSFSIGALGLVWYVYTYLTTQRFTNMAVLLLVQASVIFALGLISEQVAQLRFERTGPASDEPSKKQ